MSSDIGWSHTSDAEVSRCETSSAALWNLSVHPLTLILVEFVILSILLFYEVTCCDHGSHCSHCYVANRFDVDQCDIWQHTLVSRDDEKVSKVEMHTVELWETTSMTENDQTGCINGTKICKLHRSQCVYPGKIRPRLKLSFLPSLFMCLIWNDKRRFAIYVSMFPSMCKRKNNCVFSNKLLSWKFTQTQLRLYPC